MRGNKVVVGVFSYHDDTIKAINKVKSTKLDYKVYSPVPTHGIEAATTDTKSPVRFVNGTGALTGLTFGFGLAILCSLDWPLRVSAKDIVSIPGFVVIGYECTILFGALATLLSILHFCRLPDLLRKVGYDPRFSNDKFGVVVGCDTGEVDKIKSVLTESGAEEIQVREGL
jgi:hypothetical protein